MLSNCPSNSTANIEQLCPEADSPFLRYASQWFQWFHLDYYFIVIQLCFDFNSDDSSAKETVGFGKYEQRLLGKPSQDKADFDLVTIIKNGD